ncbi:hypothetical protein [Streptomyces sp. URMC 123]|uniref:hypothetical protein n=1 Tax=Streptomyces sp. URMC 123 TaxID=3423403 RepID=UPI003F1E1A85
MHSIDEPWAFWPENDFSRWPCEYRGISSSLTWAAEIERNTPAGSTPVEEFFRLLDAHRSDAVQNPAPSTGTSGETDRLFRMGADPLKGRGGC